MKLRRPKLPNPPRPRLPDEPPPGPARPEFWRSPLRGPWLTSLLGTALLPLVIVCAVTGFLSQAAYDPGLGRNSLLPSGGIGADVFFFDWPTSPTWIYALNQGLHVTSGLLAIPILLAKLWSVMPKLFEWPPIRSVAHLLERASLALLVGGSIFVFFTGLINVQVYYPWPFRFVPAHYYGALVFLAAFALHVGLKLPFAWRKLRERGVIAPLRADLAHTEPEPYEPEHTAPLAPAPPTITRRAMLGTVAAASLGAGWVAATQAVGGPLRQLGLLGPHSTKLGDGPNQFQVNKTAARVGIGRAETGPSWRLQLSGARRLALSREQLLALPQHTYDLPIACVEGWTTTQSWTGVRLRDLAAKAGIEEAGTVLVESLQKHGALREVTLAANQIADERCLLALRVNGVDLSLDHGFPARLVVPAAPGVHCTKWVSAMRFEAA